MSLVSELARIRRNRANAAAQVRVYRLNKDGSRSKMRDAVTYYNSVADAQSYIDRVVSLNPNQVIRFEIEA